MLVFANSPSLKFQLPFLSPTQYNLLNVNCESSYTCSSLIFRSLFSSAKYSSFGISLSQLVWWSTFCKVRIFSKSLFYSQIILGYISINHSRAGQLFLKSKWLSLKRFNLGLHNLEINIEEGNCLVTTIFAKAGVWIFKDICIKFIIHLYN